MWLGSSFTNLKPVQAAKFLRQFTQEGVLQTGDFMLIGIDRCREVEKVTAAYSDTSERWQQYIQNGLYTAAHTVGDASLAEDWTYVARWDAEEGRHLVRRLPLFLFKLCPFLQWLITILHFRR